MVQLIANCDSLFKSAIALEQPHFNQESGQKAANLASLKEASGNDQPFS
jgi:hypothetical protein